MGNSKDKRKGGRTLLKICAWGIGIWLVILIGLQAVLSPAILTGLVNRAAGDYIDGDLHFGRASASVITNFPNLNVTLEDVSLTYPPDRFTSFYGNVPDGRLLRSGHSPDADTLASFKRFSTSIDLASLIAGHIRIPSLELSKPRIFAKHYSENDANWNIFKASSEGPDSNEEEDRSGSGPLPRITVEKIVFDQKPFIVYCSPKDTLFTALHLNGLDFKGRLSTRKTHRNRISFTADTLVVAGRMASDTISLKLDRSQPACFNHYRHKDDRTYDTARQSRCAYKFSERFRAGCISARFYGRNSRHTDKSQCRHKIYDRQPMAER